MPTISFEEAHGGEDVAEVAIGSGISLRGRVGVLGGFCGKVEVKRTRAAVKVPAPRETTLEPTNAYAELERIKRRVSVHPLVAQAFRKLAATSAGEYRYRPAHCALESCEPALTWAWAGVLVAAAELELWPLPAVGWYERSYAASPRADEFCRSVPVDGLCLGRKVVLLNAASLAGDAARAFETGLHEGAHVACPDWTEEEIALYTGYGRAWFEQKGTIDGLRVLTPFSHDELGKLTPRSGLVAAGLDEDGSPRRAVHSFRDGRWVEPRGESVFMPQHWTRTPAYAAA